MESVVKEAVKGRDAAEGIVEDVMGERHLVDDSSGACSSVVGSEAFSWFVISLGFGQSFYTSAAPWRRA
jgi:hypothetical protein